MIKNSFFPRFQFWYNFPHIFSYIIPFSLSLFLSHTHFLCIIFMFFYHIYLHLYSSFAFSLFLIPFPILLHIFYEPTCVHILNFSSFQRVTVPVKKILKEVLVGRDQYSSDRNIFFELMQEEGSKRGPGYNRSSFWQTMPIVGDGRSIFSLDNFWSFAESIYDHNNYQLFRSNQLLIVSVKY